MILRLEQLAEYWVRLAGRRLSLFAQQRAVGTARRAELYGTGVCVLRIPAIRALHLIFRYVKLKHAGVDRIGSCLASLPGNDQLLLGHEESRVLGANSEMSNVPI